MGDQALPLMMPGSRSAGSEADSEPWVSKQKRLVHLSPEEKPLWRKTEKESISAVCPRSKERPDERAGTASGGLGKRVLGERKAYQSLFKDNRFVTGGVGG